MGFNEAVGVAIPLVAIYLLLNAAVVAAGFVHVFSDPSLISGWTGRLLASAGGGPMDLIGPAVIAFPLLVLGLSGFETGVSMMPLIKASGTPRNRSRPRACGIPASCSPPPRSS
jgi:hypothetical protein